ncbi:MAG: glutathione peroxidase [Rhodothermaceae bacterium TMED105]|nr:MAG: glutathione peroxidase [Rhodothermaceae bacterium TMED105]
MKIVALMILFLFGLFGSNVSDDPAVKNVTSVHEFEVQTITGKEVSLTEYKGKVLLIVNTASKCGYTPQYEGLQELYDTYQEQGFEVLGFPSGSFKQELSSDEDIAEFCDTQYSVTFPMFSKVDVRGNEQHPLFGFLTGEHDKQSMGKVKWNFEKFLVSKDGELIKRYRSRTKPMDKDLIALLEAELEKE